MAQKKRDEIPVPPQPLPEPPVGFGGLPPVSLEEVQMLLGNQAILLLQQQKEILRLLNVITTLQNQLHKTEG